MIDIAAFDSIKKHVSSPISSQILCVVFVILIFWEIISDLTLVPKLNQEVRLHTEVSLTKVQDEVISDSIKHPLFGDYVPSNLDAAGVRQSMLNLKVVGILFSENEKDSQVILQSPNGQEHFFHVGDNLPSGGTIKRITKEDVLVSRGGELERLSMPREELNFEAIAQPLPLNEQETR